MWTYVITLALIATTIVARPQEGAPTAVASAAPNQPQVDIVAQSDIVNPDGSFNFSYELSNGVRVQESGYVKKDPNVAARSGVAGDDDENSGDINVIQGSFSYTAPDGQVISLTYTADENGFQPQGDHLPTPPPVPEAIARALSAAPPEPEAAAPTGGESQT